MKNTYKILSITALFAALFFAGAGSYCFATTGSGNITKEKRDVGYFDKIVVKGGSNLFVKQDSYVSLMIETDDNIQDQIITEVKDNTLYISPKGTINTSKLNIYARMTKISGFTIKGSCDIVAKERIITDKIEFNIDGSGNIRWKDLSSNSIYMKISGSGDANIESGETHELTCVINGSGNILTDNVKSGRVYAKISGSGDIRVYPIDDLKAEIYGIGNVYYKGSPKNIKTSVKGIGEVRNVPGK